MRYQLTLSAEDFECMHSDLKELVLLRTNLVHHFIDQHDLWSPQDAGPPTRRWLLRTRVSTGT